MIRSTAVTDEGIKHLASGCPNLEILNINDNPNLTDNALKYISEGCPRIRKVMCERSSKGNFSEISYVAR